MALQSSGEISLGDIATEFGGSAPHALSEYYGKGNAPASGQIRLANDFYGTSSQFAFTISTNQTNANLATLATNAGWDGASALVVTINSGVYLSSNSTGTPALTISGSFPAGVTVTNNGIIVGMGGNGGAGGAAASNGSSGGGGGTALSVSSAVTFNNNGTIAGGGGGGGGGGGVRVYAYCADPQVGGSGGGGGQSSLTNSSGGSGGSASLNGYSGSGGSYSSAGGGGSARQGNASCYAPSEDTYYLYARGGAGGSGGPRGAGGSSGGTSSGGGGGVYNVYTRSGGAGGSGGNAVSGNSNITWGATGTRIGAIA